MDKFNFNRLVIDKASVTSQNLDLGEFLRTLIYILGYNIEDIEEKMLSEGSAKFEIGRVVPTAAMISKVESIVTATNTPTMSNDEMLELAKDLKNLFPKGIMVDGIPWTEGPILIVQRLEGFFKKFGNYSAQDIKDAMLRYVIAKSGSPYMKSLKNAIYKEVQNPDGTVELQSDLYNYLENKLDPMSYDIDWTQELRE